MKTREETPMLYRESFLRYRPQVNLVKKTPFRMYLISGCAALAILQSASTDGFSSIITSLAALLAAILAEGTLLALRGGRKALYRLLDGSAAASAFVLALLLPNRLPPALAALAAIFAIVVVKWCFGGLGSNWLNPALGGLLFIRLSWPELFAASLDASPLTELEKVNGQAALLSALGSGIFMPTETAGVAGLVSFAAEAASAFLTKTFDSLGYFVPASYLNLFYSPWDAIIADRAVLALAVSALVISLSSISRAYTGILYLVFYLFLVKISSAAGMGGPQDMFFTLCTGGTLAAAFFLLADPASSPKSAAAAIILSLCAAALTWFFRCVKGESYAAFYAIALINALTPFVRSVESAIFYERQAAV